VHACEAIIYVDDSLSHQPFEFSEALLDFRFLQHSELQMHQRGQSRRDPRVKLAGVDIGDQSGDAVSDRSS